MGLRSIKPGIAAASQMPLFMLHPRTGEMMTPLGWTKSGHPIFPAMGGAPEDDSDGDDDKDDKDDESDDEDEDKDDDSDEDEDSDDDEDAEKGKKKGNAKAKIAALTEEKDRHFRKAKKAAKRAEDAEAALAALKAKYESGDKDKDKGKTDEKPTVDDSRVKELEAKIERQAVENAFNAIRDFDWIKPEQAFALMMADDDYDVEFDRDGKVDRKSLKAELKRFARENSHLLKPKKTESKGEEGEEGGSAQGATASTMNGKRKGKKDEKPTREQLAKKFPALGRLS